MKGHTFLFKIYMLSFYLSPFAQLEILLGKSVQLNTIFKLNKNMTNVDFKILYFTLINLLYSNKLYLLVFEIYARKLGTSW